MGSKLLRSESYIAVSLRFILTTGRSLVLCSGKVLCCAEGVCKPVMKNNKMETEFLFTR